MDKVVFVGEQRPIGDQITAKLVLGFMADVLYIKQFISFDEYDTIMNVKNAQDIESIVERMLRGDFNAHKRGEGYIVAGDAK